MPLPPQIRWKRISKQESLAKGYGFYFDERKADYAVGFFDKFLTHSKGRFAGKPFTLLDWQREHVVEEIFGWCRCDNDMRRFRVGYIELPKKNGKSTLLSGIGTLLLVADGEPAAECYGCATSREQASIVYRQIAELVRASPHLRERLEVVDSRKTIACVPTNSFYKVISSDSHRAEGLNIHALLYDELHAAKDRKLFDAVRYGGASRDQSLLLSITTAGFDKATICYEQHEYAMRVRTDPSYDPTFFSYVCAAAPDDDWTSPEVWKAANPSFGVTMKEKDFAADVAEAAKSNSKLSSFLRYRLNVWTSGEDKFINAENWSKCTGDFPEPGPRAEWHCGLDLAQTWDCNAFVAVHKDHEENYLVKSKFWFPEENAHQRDVKDGVPVTRWAKDPSTGMTLTPGNTVDYEFIKRDIVQFCKDHSVRRIHVDPHNSHYLVQQLQAEGIEVVGFGQGFSSFNSSTRMLETLTTQGRLRTRNNPVLNFHAANASVRMNAEGYIKVVKPKPGSSARIDGIIALIMAIASACDAEAGKARPDPEIILL